MEKDFLDLDKWDVKQVHFDNYDFDETQRDLVKAKGKSEKHTLAYADGIMSVDGNDIYETKNMRVALFTSDDAFTK